MGLHSNHGGKDSLRVGKTFQNIDFVFSTPLCTIFPINDTFISYLHYYDLLYFVLKPSYLKYFIPANCPEVKFHPINVCHTDNTKLS